MPTRYLWPGEEPQYDGDKGHGRQMTWPDMLKQKITVGRPCRHRKLPLPTLRNVPCWHDGRRACCVVAACLAQPDPTQSWLESHH